MKRVILPIFVPHMGCPHQCVFCNQFHITGQWQPPARDTLETQAREWAASSGQVPELAFYGGSFTAIERATQEALLESAAILKAQGLISGIRLSTRPDALGPEVLARLHRFSVDTVEIGVQSLDDAVLAASRRGHTALVARDAVKRVKAAGFACGAQIMVALPEDTPARSLETCRQVIDLAPDFVRIYPTAVICDTPLAEAYARESYVPWQVDTLLDTVAEMLTLFEAASIPVIRVGLQAEDNLSQGDVIAGAYHPALGEQIKARYFRRCMMAMLKPQEEGPVTFAVAPRQLSQAIGQHRENVIYLSQQIGHPVTVVADSSMQHNQLERK